MAEYTVKMRVKVITENTTITDTDFAGWKAINNGGVMVQVNKVNLQPQQGLDYAAAIPPCTHWDSPIQILVPAGGEVVLQQLIYKQAR